MRGDETEMYYPRTHSQDRREQMADDREERMEALRERVRAKKEAVSYTHLTLPTIPGV